MKCPKCGEEFSEPILPLHIERCIEEEKKEQKKETKTPKK